MANSTRQCRQCKDRFRLDKEGAILGQNNAFFCGTDCLLLYMRKDDGKQTQLARRKLDSAERAETKKRKEGIKPRQKWLSELQALVNKYVRLRDQYDGCISCDKPATWQGQWHASHYYSRGHSSGLRFNLWNIHKSCSVCNSHLSGNIGQFTPRLIEKVGQDRYDWLTAHKSDICRYDIEYIKRAIKVARKAIKRIERRGPAFRAARLANNLQKTLE